MIKKENSIYSSGWRTLIVMIYCFSIFSCASIYAKESNPVDLLAVGNYFQALRTAASERPSIRIAKVGGEVKNIYINPQTYQGQFQVTGVFLPVEIEVKFSSYNEGRPFVIVVEKVTDQQEVLACSGVSTMTVIAYVKGQIGNAQKICIPISTSTLLTSISPIYSGDFNSVVLFIGPLGVNDVYDPNDVKSLPFRFGLMSWTSLLAPWNNQKLSSTADVKNIKFSQPLDVLQGFAALGGGFIPRAYHGSVAHIFNDTDNIILISRESSTKELAPYNISQVIPPHSIIPYALLWIPKIASEDTRFIPGHDAVRIAALAKHQTVRAPDTMSHSEISDLSADTAVNIPKGLSDLEAIIEKTQSSVSNNAADLLGVTLWNKDMKSAYADFDASKYYYTIATDQVKKATYLQRCSVADNSPEDVAVLKDPPAYNEYGNPTFYNMVIRSDAKKDSSFEVELYTTAVRPPRTR